jgi:hypothetical protein
MVQGQCYLRPSNADDRILYQVHTRCRLKQKARVGCVSQDGKRNIICKRKGSRHLTSRSDDLISGATAKTGPIQSLVCPVVFLGACGCGFDLVHVSLSRLDDAGCALDSLNRHSRRLEMRTDGTMRNTKTLRSYAYPSRPHHRKRPSTGVW